MLSINESWLYGILTTIVLGCTIVVGFIYVLSIGAEYDIFVFLIGLTFVGIGATMWMKAILHEELSNEETKQ